MSILARPGGSTREMPRRYRFTALVMLVLVALTRPASSATSVGIGYVIPSNRTEQTGAVDNLSSAMSRIQAWYGEQMDRYGFGPKTFRLESDSRGAPLVNVISTAKTDEQMRSDLWGNTINAASAGGLSPWALDHVYVLIPEAHQQQPDGSIVGGFAGGASFGSGSDGGVSVLGSDVLFRLSSAMLLNNDTYAGKIVPEFGPYPMVQDISFPWFEQNTFSSIASSVQGAMAHELGHAFGLPHDFRNDSNFRGILMGNGLRGWRGAEYPYQFAQDDVQLGYAAALVLNTSRYFNPDTTYTDNLRPTVSVTTSGAVTPTGGKLEVAFKARDASGLSAAVLTRNGDVVDQLDLEGVASVDTSFNTPYYDVGTADTYEVFVYDMAGNRQSQTSTITVASGTNRAPQPLVKLFGSQHYVDQVITLDANATTDPDDAASSLLVEWDFDNDGVFDTAPSNRKVIRTSFTTPGTGTVVARFTDPHGAFSLSVPLAYRTLPLPGIPGDYNSNGTVDAADYTVWKDSFGDMTNLTADGNGNGVIDAADYTVWKDHFGENSASRDALQVVPEPTCCCVLSFVIVVFAAARRGSTVVS